VFDPDIAFVIPVLGGRIVRKDFRDPIKDVGKEGGRPFRVVVVVRIMMERMDDDPVQIPTFP
jgi:hypothetical protein